VSPASHRAPVQRFVERVLGRTVEGYFHAAASGQKTLSFMARHDEVRLELEDRVRSALAEYRVEAVRTTLGEFEADSPHLDEFRRGLAEERDRKRKLEHKLDNAQIEEEIEQIQLADERERRKLEVVALEEQIKLLGHDVVATQILLAELTKMNVPRVVAGDAGAWLDHMPWRSALGMIEKALTESAARPPTGAQLAAAATDERHRLVVPVYVMLDESSVAGTQLNAGMSSVREALAGEPPLAGAVRLSVLGYADTVNVRLVLREGHAEAVPDRLAVPGRTRRFGAAFEWLLDRVPSDIEQLEREGFSVCRSQVLFLSGGEPDDEPGWRQLRQQLTARHELDIVACGFGDAKPETIVDLATQKELAFVASAREPKVAVDRFFEFVRTRVSSLGQEVPDRALPGGSATLVGCPDGFRLADQPGGAL
jgi:uncharacterized protein YegL